MGVIRKQFFFGDADLGHFLHVSNVGRSISPARRVNQQDTVRGSLYRPYGLDALEISVTVNVKATALADVATARRALAGMLIADTEQELVLPDEPGLYYMAYWQGGAELDRLMRWPEATLTFVAPDPLAYGDEHAFELTNSAKTIARGGTAPAKPTITAVPAAGSYWTVTNVTTGEYVRVDADFTGSQTVVLDFENERCLVNGTDHAVDIRSDFFELGEADQVRKLNGTATMTWTERWY